MVDRKEIKLQIGANTIQTGAGFEWDLKSIKGDDYMDVDVALDDYAVGDGGYITNTRYEPRYIDMRIMSKATTDNAINAAELLLKSYMDSKVDSTLTIYKNGVVRVGYGRIAAVKKVENRMWWKPPYIVVTMLMPNPWLIGSTITEQFLTERPIMTYPMSYLEHTPVTVGLAVGGNSRTFTVGGNGDTGFVLTLTATGAVVNPAVENQDGRKITSMVSLASGDVMTISTVTRDVYVRKNGVDCRYDLGSDFFQLAVGANTLTVSATSGIDNASKSLTWKENYRG